jgi:polyisoprenoid-binding protein YceI
MSTTATQPVATGNWTVDPIHSHVGFSVKHMVVATFRGYFAQYDGALTSSADGTPVLKGTVKSDSIVVKDENLAAHLKSPEFFDTATYPEISYSSTGLSLGEDGSVELEGDLTIKGNTHRVTARGTLSGPHTDIAGNDKIGVDLEAVLDRREYGLEWNAPLPKGGFAVDNDVKLEVTLELVKEA